MGRYLLQICVYMGVIYGLQPIYLLSVSYENYCKGALFMAENPIWF
jgi:hypothetical protein